MSRSKCPSKFGKDDEIVEYTDDLKDAKDEAVEVVESAVWKAVVE